MNVSAVASSALEQILEELENGTGATSSATPTSSTSWVSLSSSGEGLSTDETYTSNRAVPHELVELLKSLAPGDTIASKADLKKLASEVTSDHQASASAMRLSKTISFISKARDAGDTLDALSGLSTYLIRSGQNTGNLLDIAA